jgi:hypothetical protein
VQASTARAKSMASAAAAVLEVVARARGDAAAAVGV